MSEKITPRQKRKARIRKKIAGTASRPRLSVYKSLNHTYAQVVDDSTGRTIAFVGTNAKGLKDSVKDQKKTEAAKKVGAAVAKAAMEKGVTQVVFDRNGFDYHGRIAAVAEAAREAGLKF
ncbi:MAG TPA: 50S ribosomal protein L18 [Anaeromyxobacteraceae bacterium]|nr:50S ribosomal protein L18 [Anaeromyxobacteraceae bacterium]